MTGRQRNRLRRLDGIVLLDKPQGLSSNQALQKVRWILRAEKAGHTGALDPLATGMLPICLGEATKIAGLLLSKGKAYRARVQLGADTDTDDVDGQVIRERPVPIFDRERLNAVVAQFIGRIQQVPPRYSALKRDGEPLYRRARRGEAFEVPAREVEIRSIEVRDFGADWIDLTVECGSGTYIRSLARDIGDALGCGGHIVMLRRLWVDPFHDAAMFSMEQLAECADQGDAGLNDILLPIEAGLRDWRRQLLTAEEVRSLRYGQRVPTGAAPGPVLAVDPEGAAVGLTDIGEDGMLAARRLFVPAAE